MLHYRKRSHYRIVRFIKSSPKGSKLLSHFLEDLSTLSSVPLQTTKTVVEKTSTSTVIFYVEIVYDTCDEMLRYRLNDVSTLT